MSELHNLIESLSPARLLAQCVMPRLSAEVYWADESERSATLALARRGVGGFCVFRGEVADTARMLAELQAASELPLIIAADFEWGVAMRISGGTAFPQAMALGVADDPETTRRAARAIALEARALGIHWNFAPVCDINSNPCNPVIGARSFGSTAELAARHASAYVVGTQEGKPSERVLACAKHFPGHGDTSADSHKTLPVAESDLERLRTFELAPFRAAITAGVRSVMAGHIALPALDADSVPASLSRSALSKLLREELGFEGLIVTDALDMRAVERFGSNAEIAAQAFTAGADVLLLPPKPDEAFDALESAFRAGAFSLRRAQDSARRMLEAKLWCGIADASGRKLRRSTELGADATREHRLFALEAAKSALRWSGERERVQPLGKFAQIAGFALLDEGSERGAEPATAFFRYLAQAYAGDCDFGFLDASLADADLAALASGISGAEAVVFAVFARPETSASDAARLPKRLQECAQILSAGRVSLAAFFGAPFAPDALPATATLNVFSASEPSLGAAAFEMNVA